MRKDTDLDVDCPTVVGNQRMHGVKPAHADRGIDLDLGAHLRGAVEDALDEGTLGPGAHILFREAWLQGGHLLHRADRAPRFRRTAVDDA